MTLRVSQADLGRRADSDGVSRPNCNQDAIRIAWLQTLVLVRFRPVLPETGKDGPAGDVWSLGNVRSCSSTGRTNTAMDIAAYLVPTSVHILRRFMGSWRGCAINLFNIRWSRLVGGYDASAKD